LLIRQSFQQCLTAIFNDGSNPTTLEAACKKESLFFGLLERNIPPFSWKRSVGFTAFF
jgi:hypothetical protein